MILYFDEIDIRNKLWSARVKNFPLALKEFLSKKSEHYLARSKAAIALGQISSPFSFKTAEKMDKKFLSDHMTLYYFGRDSLIKYMKNRKFDVHASVTEHSIFTNATADLVID